METVGDRDKLVAAAKKVLSRGGRAGFKIEAILEESNLSTRSFYRHFAKKDDLLFALLAEVLEEMETRLRKAVSEQTTCAGKIEAYLMASIDTAFNPKLTKRTLMFALHWRELIAEYPDEMSAATEKLVAPLAEVMQAGQESGEITCTDPLSEARTLYFMVLSINSDEAVLREPGRQHDVEQMVLGFVNRAIGLPV